MRKPTYVRIRDCDVGEREQDLILSVTTRKRVRVQRANEMWSTKLGLVEARRLHAWLGRYIAWREEKGRAGGE